MQILVVNGPNLKLLGKREPEIYGTDGLSDLETRLRKKFPEIQFEFFQSNIEGELINALHRAFEGPFAGVVFNPGAYTHTSVALRDAVAALNVPVVEVHLSNIDAREEFRRISVIAPACKGSVTGFGMKGYELAVRVLSEE